jgi:hypothetical protein
MNTTEEHILNVLGSQRFADWYEDGNFGAYIRGDYPKDDPHQPTEEKIIADIRRMFEVK